METFTSSFAQPIIRGGFVNASQLEARMAYKCAVRVACFSTNLSFRYVNNKKSGCSKRFDKALLTAETEKRCEHRATKEKRASAFLPTYSYTKAAVSSVSQLQGGKVSICWKEEFAVWNRYTTKDL